MPKKFLTSLKLVNLASDPVSGTEGELYFNTASNHVRLYSNGEWKKISTSDVNLTGIDSIASPDFIQFDTTANTTPTKGLLGWDSAEGTLNLGLSENKHIHVGEELVYRVRNSSSAIMLKGTAVYASGVEPSGRISVSPYVADGSVREVRFMGLLTENISAGVNGFVQSFGYIKDLDTRGTNSTAISVGDENWSAGDILYVHPTVPGKLTNVKPQHEITVALLLARHQSTGILFIRPTTGGHIEDIHDISITNPQEEDVLVYNASSSVWQNESLREYLDPYLTIESASTTYLTQSSADSLYQSLIVGAIANTEASFPEHKPGLLYFNRNDFNFYISYADNWLPIGSFTSPENIILNGGNSETLTFEAIFDGGNSSSIFESVISSGFA